MATSTDTGPVFYEDIDGALAAASDSTRYPVLAAALTGAMGGELRRELVKLVGPQLHLRAPRRYLRVMGRLEGASYEEPVLLTDISATGARFLVSTSVPLDITHAGDMRLHLRTSAGPRTLPVALVRCCGGDERHTDVACRFLTVEADHPQIVAEVRSTIFGDASTHAS